MAEGSTRFLQSDTNCNCCHGPLADVVQDHSYSLQVAGYTRQLPNYAGSGLAACATGLRALPVAGILGMAALVLPKNCAPCNHARRQLLALDWKNIAQEVSRLRSVCVLINMAINLRAVCDSDAEEEDVSQFFVSKTVQLMTATIVMMRAAMKQKKKFPKPFYRKSEV